MNLQYITHRVDIDILKPSNSFNSFNSNSVNYNRKTLAVAVPQARLPQQWAAGTENVGDSADFVATVHTVKFMIKMNLRPPVICHDQPVM